MNASLFLKYFLEALANILLWGVAMPSLISAPSYELFLLGTALGGAWIYYALRRAMSIYERVFK